MRIAADDRRITADDIEFLKTIIVDRFSGRAQKLLPDGTVAELEDAEKERLAKIVIELCLYIYARQAKTVSETRLEDLRKKLASNVGDEDGLLPLFKIANTIANKVTMGTINTRTIEKYLRALSGERFAGDDSRRYENLRNKGKKRDDGNNAEEAMDIG